MHLCVLSEARDVPRLEASLYRFNTASDGQMAAFLKMDRDSESIVWYLGAR